MLRARRQRGSVGRQALLAHDVSNDCDGGLAFIACRCSQQHIALLLTASACQQMGHHTVLVNRWLFVSHPLQRSHRDGLQADSLR